jgi:polar amino acid transport system substrate-binding protein
MGGLGFLLAALPQAFAADQVLFLQDNAYAPYMTVENGMPAGLYAEILFEAQRRMDASNLSVQAVPWTRATVFVLLCYSFWVFVCY